MLALGDYSALKDKYEQQLELNQAAEEFARQVCLLPDYFVYRISMLERESFN